MRVVTRFVPVVSKLNRLAAPHEEGLLGSNRGVEIHHRCSDCELFRNLLKQYFD